MDWTTPRALDAMTRVRHKSVLTTGPVSEPVSVAEFKSHARIDHNHEDDKIASYLTAARGMLEADTRRLLMPQTWTMRLDWMPSHIVLDVAPVQSITSITYYDGNNTLQTLSTSLYESDLYAEPALIRPSFGSTWPVVYDRLNAVSVVFVCGYTAASEVPEEAKQAIKMLAGHWYRTGEAVADNITHDVRLSYDALCSRLQWGAYA